MPLIVVVTPPMPQVPAKAIVKLIFALLGFDIVDERVVVQALGENDNKNNAPGVQFTVTVEVAVSVPVTAIKVPKSMSDTARLHP